MATVTDEVTDRKDGVPCYEARIAELRKETSVQSAPRRSFNQMMNKLRFRTPKEQYEMLSYGLRNSFHNMPDHIIKGPGMENFDVQDACTGTFPDEDKSDEDFKLTLKEADALGKAPSNVEIKWVMQHLDVKDVAAKQAPSAAAWFILGRMRHGGMGWLEWGRKVWAGTVSAKEGHDSGERTRDESARDLSGLDQFHEALEAEGVELPDGSKGLEE